MGAIILRCGDALVGVHVDADTQYAFIALRRTADRCALHGRGDADTRPRRITAEHEGRDRDRRQESALVHRLYRTRVTLMVSPLPSGR
jgi:hypothetical protein